MYSTFKKKYLVDRGNCQDFGQNVIFSVINVYNASVTHCFLVQNDTLLYRFVTKATSISRRSFYQFIIFPVLQQYPFRNARHTRY